MKENEKNTAELTEEQLERVAGGNQALEESLWDTETEKCSYCGFSFGGPFVRERTCPYCGTAR